MVNDLKNDTFFAKIVLNVDGGLMEVDSRPSDALALAVRVEAPIYVEETVLDKAGILLDQETGKPISSEKEEGGASGKGKKPSEEELKRMSAFYDFINTLDLEDFDKRKS
jgi:bifunctional DNase/RNase